MRSFLCGAKRRNTNQFTNFKDKRIFQNMVFPEGIQYDKKTNRCRTKEVNFFIRHFSQLSKDAAEIKSGDSNFIFEIPALVGFIGLNPNEILEELRKLNGFLKKVNVTP